MSSNQILVYVSSFFVVVEHTMKESWLFESLDAFDDWPGKEIIKVAWFGRKAIEGVRKKWQLTIWPWQ